MTRINYRVIGIYAIGFIMIQITSAAKQKLMLSDSYLPATLQLITHLTNQLDYKAGKSVSIPTTTTNKPTDLVTWTSKPNNNLEATTQYHKPGVYAPSNPLPHKTNNKARLEYILLPPHNNNEYSVIQPQDIPVNEKLLDPEIQDNIEPIIDNVDDTIVFLPPTKNKIHEPHFMHGKNPYVKSVEYTEDLPADSLQYLPDDVREILKIAYDPNDRRAVDIFADDRQTLAKPTPPRMSHSNLRLTLLYDLLSKDAKKQHLQLFNGFSDKVLRELADAGEKGPVHQLKYVFQKMIDRSDSSHQYANNRVKEMIKELDKSSSLLTNEIKELKPLTYKIY